LTGSPVCHALPVDSNDLENHNEQVPRHTARHRRRRHLQPGRPSPVHGHDAGPRHAGYDHDHHDRDHRHGRVTKAQAKDLKIESKADYKARKNIAEANHDLNKADCKVHTSGAVERACKADARAAEEKEKADAKLVHKQEQQDINAVTK
jgi:hypothetical protein